MKKLTKDVHMTKVDSEGNKVRVKVAVAEIDAAETIEEAIELDGVEIVLHKRNTLTLAAEANRLREIARGGPSSKSLREKAILSILPEEWAEIAGDKEAIDAKIEEKTEELKKQTLLEVATV